jgi:hypothetical protein
LKLAVHKVAGAGLGYLWSAPIIATASSYEGDNLGHLYAYSPGGHSARNANLHRRGWRWPYWLELLAGMVPRIAAVRVVLDTPSQDISPG